MVVDEEKRKQGAIDRPLGPLADSRPVSRGEHDALRKQLEGMKARVDDLEAQRAAETEAPPPR